VGVKECADDVVSLSKQIGDAQVCSFMGETTTGTAL